MVSPTLAIARATSLSWKNALRRVWERAPAMAALGAVLTLSIPALLVFMQLQSALPILSQVSVESLGPGILVRIGQVSLVGVASVAWGAALLMDLAGVVPAPILAVAATRGISPLRRATGSSLPVIVPAVVVAVLIAGPLAVAFLVRVLQESGSSGGSYLVVLSCLGLVGAALAGASVPLLIRGCAQRLLGRHVPDLVIKMVAGSASALVLIWGLSALLFGHQAGAYLVVPPLVLSQGIPQSVPELIIFLLGVSVCVVGAVGALAVSSNAAGQLAGGVALLVRRRRSGLLWTSVVRGLRDPMCLTSASVCVVGVLTMRVVAWSNDQDPTEQGGLILLLLTGVASLSGTAVAWQWCTDAWSSRVRSGGLAKSFLYIPLAVCATGLTAVAATRLASGFPFVLEMDSTIFATALAGCMLACAGTLVVAATSGPQQRSTLVIGDLVGGAVLFLAYLGIDKVSGDKSWGVGVSLWLAVATIALGVAYLLRVVRWPEVLAGAPPRGQ